MLNDAQRELLYRAEGHADADGGTTLYRTFGIAPTIAGRPAPPATARSTATAVRSEPVLVAGYAVRWGERARGLRGLCETFPGPRVIANDGHRGPRLVLGHGGPELSSQVATRCDRTGYWCAWRLDPLLVDPAVIDYATGDERGLSVQFIDLAPPKVYLRTATQELLDRTSVWIMHVALLLPGQQPAYVGAHTEIV